jgi:hypothetical protein
MQLAAYKANEIILIWRKYKMKIKRQILQPYLTRLRGDFETLGRELYARAEDERVAPLAELTREKIREIENLTLPGSGYAEDVNDPFESFKKLKVDLRTAKRKWLRVLSNEARCRKLRNRRDHVTTFAA